MKIEISELESHEISIPEKINIRELSVIVDRLKRILKMSGIDEDLSIRDKDTQNTENEPITKSKAPTSHRYTMEQAKEICKVYYSDMDENEKKVKLLEVTGWNDYKKAKKTAYYLNRVYKFGGKK